MYREGMQVKFKYGYGPISIGGVIALALRNVLKMTVSIHILDLVYMFLAHLSQRLNLAIVIVICLSFYVINIKEQFFFNFYFLFLKGKGGGGILIHLHQCLKLAVKLAGHTGLATFKIC